MWSDRGNVGCNGNCQRDLCKVNIDKIHSVEYIQKYHFKAIYPMKNIIILLGIKIKISNLYALFVWINNHNIDNQDVNILVLYLSMSF